MSSGCQKNHELFKICHMLKALTCEATYLEVMKSHIAET